jgi:hypothetical protein
MLARLIQSIFFLSVCSSLQAMNTKQKNIVHTKLYEKYDIAETPKNSRSIMQPLPEIIDSTLIKLNRTKLVNENKEDKQALDEYKTQQTFNQYNTIKNRLPNDLSILKPETQNRYTAINNTVNKYALEGNTTAQSLIIEQYIDKLNPIINAPEFLEKIKFQQCLYAYEFLDFTTKLKSNNIPATVTDSQGKQLIDIRNQTSKTNPSVSYIIQSIYYLQSVTESESKFRYSKLSNMTPETSETEAICQLLINYGDSTLSPQDVVKKFIETINNCGNDTKQIIQTIKNCKSNTLSPQDIAEQLKRTVTSQKKSADLLTAIAKNPLFSKVIQKLSCVTLDSNDPLISDFNYILAELHYKDNNYAQADSFYKKNKVAFLKEKKVQLHAFTTSITTAQSFGKQDIHYLSSLVGNIYNQLKKIDTTNPVLSYKVGLLIYALINNNPKMDISEKTNMLSDALRHLEYAQKDGNLNATEQKKGGATCLELHTLLSTIYTNKNDHVAALKHTKHALQYRAPNNPITQEHAIATILDNAEKNNPELYKQHAQFIQHIIDFIFTKNHVSTIQKNYTPPAEFVSSDLCKQLLPYCEHLCEKNKNSDNEIIRLIALSHVDTKNPHKVCEYIDKLSQPLSNADLLLKARIYIEKEQKLSDTDLETILKSFIVNKKTFFKDQEIILYLIAFHNDFFVQTKNHDFVIKLITKLNNQHNPQILPLLAETSILLALYVTKSLHDMESPDSQEWQKKLISCPQFYTNLGAPSRYNGETNITAGALCMQNTLIPNYEKTISYFVAAIDSNELLPEIVEKTKKTVAALYDEWAMATTDDHSTRIALFDKALQYDNHSDLQFKKAMTILNHSDDQDLVNNALQLLENIPQESSVFGLSRIALVQAYCNHSNDLTRIPMLQKLIPLNINKAITYLQHQINNEELLKTFVYICIQNADAINNWDEKNIHLRKALEHINILIDNNPTNIDYISHRMELHAKLNQLEKAITDIDLILNAQDISNSRNITKKNLLLQKIDFLLPKNLDDIPYKQIITCFEQLKVYNEKNIIRFNTFHRIQKHTQYIIENNIFTDDAIEWCCFAANACITADNTQKASQLSAEQERYLANYILSAAKTGNLDAQLVALPYCNAIAYVSTSNLTDILRYSRQALLNANSIKKRANTLLLIDVLQLYTKTGVALAYYVLCDYYKGHPQEVEKVMMLFNEAKEQEHPRDDAADLIQEICASCKDTLLTYYVERDIKNQKQSIAFFTLGSMYQYSNTTDLLEKGIGYLWAANNDLNYKSSPYELPIKKFLGISYYKLAVMEEQSGTINYEQLCTSAKIGSLEAVHKLANIYIEQHNNNTQNIPVKPSDFMPRLERVLDYPASRELFEKCQKILKSENKDHSITYTTNPTNLSTLLSNQTEITNDQIIDCAINATDFMMQSSHTTKLVKHTNYIENNKKFTKAIESLKKKNGHNKAIVLLQQAVKQKKPNVCMLLTLLYTQTATNTEDYQKIEIMLDNALLYGLVENNTTKLFHNKLFLNLLISTITTLTTDELPEKNRRHLLSIINNTLTNNNVDMETFYALFKESIGIDLLSLPEWTGKNEIKSETPRIISEARKIIVKDINDTEVPADVLKSFTASQQGDKITAAKEMYFAATTKKMPSAFMLLSWNYLLGISVTKDYDIAEEYLQEALTYGLIEKQFCSDNFLYTLYSCMSNLISNERLPYIVKKSLLQIIKQNLTDHGVDITAFCTVVKESTNIDLLSVPEWTAHNNNNNNNNNRPNNKIISLETEQPKPSSDVLEKKSVCAEKELQSLLYKSIANKDCTIDEFRTEMLNQAKTIKLTDIVPQKNITEVKKQLIKDLNNNNVSEDFQKALTAVAQKNASEGIRLLELAAENHDPCACITIAINYLLGKVVTRKSLFLSMCSLQEALSYGLIEQQFCNSLFLNKLCNFIQHVVSVSYTPDEIKFKKQLLLHIKAGLIKHKISLEDFYDIISNEVNIQLHTYPEWIEAEKDSQFTENELKSFLNESIEKKDFTIDEFKTEMLNQAKTVNQAEIVQQKNITELKKQLIKDLTNSTVSEDFKKAFTAIIQKDSIKSVMFLELASNNGDPCADITIATNHLLEKEKTKNSLLISIAFLKKSLDKGLIKEQFCNCLFFNKLCKFIQNVVSVPYMPDEIKFKKQALWLIKEILLEHDINLMDFYDLISHEVKIQLQTYPEWRDAEKDSVLTEEELRSSLNESFIGQAINTFLKNPDHKESPDFLKATEEMNNNNAKGNLDLLKKLAEKDKHPQAFLTLSIEYLRGLLLRKNIQLSEKNLKNALEYGVSEKQFSNYGFLKALCNYIHIITQYSKTIQQKFLSIIKKTMKEKDIDIKLFESIFKDAHKIDLSTIPEWKI